MLTELTIRNFAIIDDLRMQFAGGFHVLTGETGAGKSIILDAMTLVLGGRADTSMVRAGCEEAQVEAVFKLTPQLQALIQPILQQEALEDEDGDYLVLGRELRLNGRNVSRVNGRTVNLSLMREIAEPLIDIHGQGEHLSLLRPRSHLPLLDSYANLDGERRAFAQEVAGLQEIQRELNALRRDERLLAQRMDMLEFQIEEITAANLHEGEEEELRTERTRLANAEQLMRYAAEATTLLLSVGDETPSVIDILGEAERALAHLARLDPTKTELLENLQGLSFQLNELAADVQDYQEQLEYDPDRLNYLEERLEVINTLKRKYGDNISDILALRERALVELDKITHSEERIEALEKEQEQRLRHLGVAAQALSDKRQAAARRLAAAVEAQLADLNMVGARFDVAFSRETAADGVYVGEERLAFDKSGIDRAEFIISANPGEPLKPMAKVASGGETARLMLALKTALAEVDATPTLIFDEIDQGIGGRVGDIVGRKLWGLTAVADHQVIVVTHLPQLAGYGDVHFHVSKHVVSGRTMTAVRNLDVGGRVDELAAMLGTRGEHAIGGAQAILTQAQTVKQQGKAQPEH